MANKRISELTELTSGNVENEDWFEVQEADVAESKKITLENATKIERDARIAQDNVIEAGIGSNTDGTYNTPSGTTYLDSTTSVMNALATIDTALAAVAGSGSTVSTAEIHLSTTEIQSLYATPQLVLGSLENGIYHILSAFAYFDYGTTAFGCASGEDMILYYTGHRADYFMEWDETFLESTSDNAARGTWTSNLEMYKDAAVYVALRTANPTYDANHDGEIYLYVTYISQTLSFLAGGGS